MTALKIPHGLFFYWLRRDHRTSHGPHWHQLPRWRIVVKHYPLDIRWTDPEWRYVAAMSTKEVDKLFREFWRLQKVWTATPDDSKEEAAAHEAKEEAWRKCLKARKEGYFES